MSATTTFPATITITSTSTPALNGTYNVGERTNAAGLQAEINAVALNSTFADGSESLIWPDSKGTGHSFTVAQFKTFALAIALYQAQTAQYVAGVTSVAPANTATIP